MRKLTGLALVVGLAASLLLYLPLGHAAEPLAIGHVTGEVQTEGSISEDLACTQQQIVSGLGYTFTGVAIEGVFRDSSENEFRGQIEFPTMDGGNVKGRALACNLRASDPNDPYALNKSKTGTGDVGRVNSHDQLNGGDGPALFTGTGALGGVNIVGALYGADPVGAPSGWGSRYGYYRDGPYVQVILHTYTKINPPTGDLFHCVLRNPFNEIYGYNPACEHGTVYVSAMFVPNMVDNLDGSWERADFHGTWGSTKTW